MLWKTFKHTRSKYFWGGGVQHSIFVCWLKLHELADKEVLDNAQKLHIWTSPTQYWPSHTTCAFLWPSEMFAMSTKQLNLHKLTSSGVLCLIGNWYLCLITTHLCIKQTNFTCILFNFCTINYSSFKTRYFRINVQNSSNMLEKFVCFTTKCVMRKKIYVISSKLKQ